MIFSTPELLAFPNVLSEDINPYASGSDPDPMGSWWLDLGAVSCPLLCSVRGTLPRVAGTSPHDCCPRNLQQGI